VFLCCLLAGLSICWFNTVCFVLCISNFPANRSLALSLTVSFNGVSAALYTLAYNAINPTSPELYLLLNALIPLVFLCCLLAGLSICWFNTVCFVLCISNFPANRSLALSLTVSFNGLCRKVYFARTGWLAIALLPTPIALFLLASSGTASALQVGTALMGLSSGFIFAAAVSITSELFGPNSVGVNHNILITNIPIGSLIYGFLAALVYDSHGTTGIKSMTDSVVCMGRGCYRMTFVWWGCLSVLGLGSSLVLFIRTRKAYQRFEQARISSNIDS
ncbi:hypothetical protein F2Q68_00037163, partial [Brassica cretica]